MKLAHADGALEQKMRLRLRTERQSTFQIRSDWPVIYRCTDEKHDSFQAGDRRQHPGSKLKKKKKQREGPDGGVGSFGAELGRRGIAWLYMFKSECSILYWDTFH